MTLREKDGFPFVREHLFPSKPCASRIALRFIWFTLLFLCLFSVVSRSDAAGCFSAPPGLVGWWTADGNANDIAGTNNGTLMGGATANAPGEVGPAFSFDGTNGFVQVPNAPALQPTNLTIEAWVQFSSLDSPGLGGSPAGNQYIVFKQNSRSANFEGFDLAKTRTGSNDVFLFLCTSSSAQSSEVHSITTISTNVWYHIAGVRGSNFLQIYVNGVLEQQTNITFPQDYGNLPLYFGTTGEPYWDHKLAGNLDEVSLYNRPLSSNEIASIYAAGSSGKCKEAEIALQPQDTSVMVNSNATFTAAATGFGVLSYQWQFNGAPIAGATNPSVTLANVQLTNDGDYDVVVTNTLGSATSTVAVLTVLAPPTITQQPQSQTVAVGSDPRIAVSAEGTQPLYFQLLYNGSPVFDINGNGATNWGYVLLNVQTSQAGTYAWAVSNAYGSVVSSNAILTVDVPVSFTQQPQSQNKAIGGQATLSVAVTGTAPFTYQWYSNSAPLSDGGRISGTATATLSISDLQTSDTGSYSVVVSNAVSTAQSSPANLAVLFPVVLAKQPQSQTVFAGSNATFIVSAFGDGPVGYSWLFNGAPLSDNGRILGSQTPTLSISNVQAADAGIYAVVVTNPVSSVPSSNAVLTVLTPPSFPTPPADQVLAVGSNLNFNITVAGSQPISYQWFFNSGPLTDGVRITGSASNVLNIANLQTTDSGPYYLVASNIVGSATSAVANVTVFIPPSFPLQLANQTWITGSNYTLTSLAVGTLPISYQWFQNGVMMTDNGHFTGTATSTLSVSNVQTSDAATYAVVASNYSATISSNVVITVVVPPVITTQPRGYSVPLGFPVTLTGGASGTAPVGFQWILNGSPVPSATGPSLVISNTAPTNYGNYQLVATNAGGAATGAVAQLTLGPVGTWGSFTQVAVVPLWPAAGLSNVVAIAAGGSFSLALRGDGTLLEWGGNNSVTNLPTNLTSIVGIAAGANHALALRADGTVVAWGLNTSGQTNVPAGLSNVIALAAGTAHSAALRSDGTVAVWGSTVRELQTNVPPGLFRVTAIDAGGSQTIALREDGMAVSWGGSTPLPVPAGLGPLMGVAAGQSTELNQPFAMAVGSNGLVSVWGPNSNPNGVLVSVPTNIPPGLNGVAAVDAGGGNENTLFAMAMRSNGTVVVWGTGNPATVGFPITNVPAGATNVVAIAAGMSHALVLVNDGRPQIIGPPIGGTFYSGRDLVLNAKAVGAAPLSYLWLKDGNPVGTTLTLDVPSAQSTDAGSYQLIVSNALGIASSVPVPVVIVDSPPVLRTQPQTGFAYYGSPFEIGAALIGSGPLTMQWLQNGVPDASGTNDLVFSRAMPPQAGAYQLIASNPFGAVTSSVAQITFTRLAQGGTGPALSNAPFNLGTVVAVASGYSHALALNADGTVSAWATNSTTATNVPAGLSNVVALAAGNNASLALKSDGTVTAWGSVATNVPAGLSNVVAVAAGGSQELALLANGTVVGWGAGSQATPPAGLSNVVAIAAGSVHSLALKGDGTIVGWGSAGKIPATTNAVAISAGYGQSLALQANGTVLAWSAGGGATGLPANLNNVVAISAGGGYLQQSFAVALKADGTLVAWGINDTAGQLNIPAGVNSAIAISAGGGSTLAYLNDRSPFITAQPFDRHLASGTNVTLAAFAVGQPALNYQWYFKGTNIPGATAATLPLTGLNRSSRGDYYAVVWNGLGTNNSRDMQLAVGGPVQFFQSSAGGGGAGGAFSVFLKDSFGGSLSPSDASYFTVLTSSNLVDWVPLANALTYTNGTFLLQDPAPPNQPQKFYQIVEP